MTALVLAGGRVLDPATGADRVADVVVDGTVLGIDVAPPPGAERIDVAGCLVTPGWIDAHVHVFGDIGLADPDTAGVLAGVTGLIDAGSAGTLTIDELLALGDRCRTDLRSILYLDRRGIADVATIPTRVADLPSVPVGEIRRAVERHGERIVAVKTGIYADLGLPWARVALAVADLVGRPAYFHIGNFAVHRTSDVGLMADFLDLLRPGDIVTHAYTGAPGGLLDERGALLAQALDAAERGVVFDLGHSGGGFDVAVARTALAAGLRVRTASSDLALLNVRQRVRSFADVLGKLWALGFELPEVVAMATTNTAAAFRVPVGSLRPGGRADLTVAEVVLGPTRWEDSGGVAFEGPGALRPRLVVKDGVLVPCAADAVLAEANLRFRVLEPPGAPGPPDARAADLLDRLAGVLPDVPADGEVLELVVHHLADGVDLDVLAAASCVRRAFADRDTGNQVGWLLAEACHREGVHAVAVRLQRAAEAVRPREVAA